MNRILSILPFLGLLCFELQAQSGSNLPKKAEGKEPGRRTCASEDLHRRSPKRTIYSGGEEFEAWLKKMENAEETKSVQADEIYTIPVVFHILSFGEPIDSGRNINDSRAIEQIEILNNDFGKLAGTPGFNTHPAGADTRIRFCRAGFDPNGLPTTGIVRVTTTQANFDYSADNTIIKGYSLWDPNRYLNVWVCSLKDSFLGYAQYPYTDSLQFNGQADVQPDGIVIDYRAFGNVPPGKGYPSYNKGRTATHEIGHYLGLLHTWGDVQLCSQNGTDFCDDTPQQANYTSGCPTTIPLSCDGVHPNMQENYLDYTNDRCMNIFTNDQKRRMRIVMRNAPRRKTLSATPTLCGLSEIQAFVLKKNWELFPNPSIDEITLKNNMEAPLGRIEIRDLTGKLCFTVLAASEIEKTISVNQLLPGWYIASVSSTDGKISHRKFAKL